MQKKKVSKKTSEKIEARDTATEPPKPTKPPDDVIKRSRFERELEVILTREEVESVSSTLVHTLRERETKELEFKEQAKRNRGILQDLQISVRKLIDSVSGRTELREITCERELNYSTGRVTDHRMDTGEILSEREMTEKERQVSLAIEEEFSDDELPEPEDDDKAEE